LATRARPTPAAPASARPTLLDPRVRPGRPVDAATREAFITRQRHRARRLRRVRRSLRALVAVLVAGLTLAALVVVVAAAAHSVGARGLLAVADLAVEGAHRVPEAAVRAAAGIEPGTSLLALDVAAVVDRVEALPGVRRARVVRHLPNRVAIWLEERDPYTLASVGGADGGLVWIDPEGYLVGPEPHGTIPPLPVLSGVERPAAGAEQPVGDRLRVGLGLVRAVERTGRRLAARISEIDVERHGGPVLYLNDGVTVWLGGEEWDERLGRLDAVLAELEARGERLESVDLRFRDLVVLRPPPASGARSAAGPGDPPVDEARTTRAGAQKER
jgi:cell division protein FtsQ